MGLEMSDGSGSSFDSGKSSGKGKPGGKGGSMGEAFWEVLGFFLALALIYLVAQSSQHARTVPVESYAPDGTRIPVEGRSR